ncbi:hypothetical protein OPT61_g4278 [Boeremia exigua]|uniref:Uncharacterized protein n=1 Tax=Boeremia exigua TaxID=749465 RepID=A0ACC2IEP1_9PLEO|nr:hypothetical protein OPT61_g4278 [Boeremia exigua]
MDRPQVSIPPAADVLGTIGTVYVTSEIICRVLTNSHIIPQYAAPNECKFQHLTLSEYGTTIDERAPKACPERCLFSGRYASCSQHHSRLQLIRIGGVPFGVYAIVQNFSFALQFQPQAFAALTLISWGQTLYYHNKWKAWTATVATILLATSFGVMEVILIFTLQGPYDRGVKWPMMLMAISATLIQIAGLIPPYFELAKRNGRVIGIDFWFLLIDYAGAFFSLMALVAQQWFDSLGGSLYIACMLLETGIFMSQAIWLWRVRHIRREAKKAGKTYDEYVSENSSKDIPRSDSCETVVDLEACHDSQNSNTMEEKVDAESTDKQQTTAEAPTLMNSFAQKWKQLVLRPIPANQS